MKRLLGIVLSFCILGSYNVFAATQDDLNQKVQEKQKIQENINEEKNKEKDVKEKLNEIEGRMNEMYGVLNEIQSSLDGLNSQKQQLTAELDQANADLERQTETLKTRLRVVYEDGVLSYLNILLESDSIFDFFYNFEIVKQISEYDSKVLKSIEEKKAEIEDSKAKLQVVIDEEDAKKQEQQSKLAEVKKEEQQYENLRLEIAGNIKEYEKQLAAAAAEEQKIREEIARIVREQEALKKQQQATAAAQNAAATISVVGSGSLLWPCSGSVTSQFNPARIHPIYGFARPHNGIDIGVPTGTPIAAADAGTVIKALYNSSYGYYVAINHGNGIVTLYAHNSQLLVSAGQTVTKGQIIAKSGNTGASTGPHCHFEVQVNGSAVNPFGYLK